MSELLATYTQVAQRPLTEREPRWSLPIEHLSPSSLGMAKRCLEQFRRRYILGEKERPGEAAVIGTVVHSALEHNYQQKIASHTDLPLPEVIEFLHDEGLPREIEKRGGPEEIEWDLGLDGARVDAERCTSAYYRTIVPRIQPTAVEQLIEIWPVQLPVKLIGYIDLETEPRVIDTKTGKRAQTSIKPSWRLQADTYASVVGKPVEYHTISRAKTPTITTPVERGDDLVVYPMNTEALFSSLGQLASLIEFCWMTYGPDEPWPTTGRIGDFTQNKLACDFCGWRKTCVAWRE